MASPFEELEVLIGALADRITALEATSGDVSKIVRVHVHASLTQNEEAEVVARAPDGYYVVGGGYSFGGNDAGVVVNFAAPYFGTAPEAFAVRFVNGNLNAIGVEVYANCIKASELVERTVDSNEVPEE